MTKVSKRPWSSHEIAELKAGLAQGKAPREIEISGRSANAKRNQASRLGLVGDGISRTPWSDSEKALLEELFGEGMSAKDVYESGSFPGKSQTAIQKQMSRNGLIDPTRSALAKSATRLDEKTIEVLHNFLRRYGQLGTPEQLAHAWNKQMQPEISRGKVVYHLTQLNIKPGWSEVIRMPYSVNKRKRRSKAQIRVLEDRWAAFHQQQEAELKDLAKTRRREARKADVSLSERVCRECRKRFPLEEPFFHYSSKLTSAGRQKYFCRLCRICENKRRRKQRKALAASKY